MATPPDNDYTKNLAPPLPRPNRLWTDKDPDETLWNKSLPYQLILVQVESKNGEPVYSQIGGFAYTLPVGLQELEIDLPIATVTTATLGGISETHGGAPFRDIVMTGTTGITPKRGKATSGLETDNILGGAGKTIVGVFGGTADAIQRVRTAVSNVSSGLNTIRPNINQDEPQGDVDSAQRNNTIPKHSTGYYQYLLLQRFIENYVEIKSKSLAVQSASGTVEGKNIRLALAIWKEKSVYLCSGVALKRKKSATTNPHLVTFTLQLRAWARVELQGQSSAPFAHDLVGRKPNLIADAFNRLRAARDTIDAANDAIRAVVVDASETVTQAIRQTGLFLKSVAGIQRTINDFPQIIQNEARRRIAAETELRKQFESLIPPAETEVLNYDLTTGADRSHLEEPPAGQDPLAEVFKVAPVNAFRFPAEIRRQIQDEVTKAEALNRLDFEIMRATLQGIADQYAFKVGAGDDDYSTTYDLGITNADRTPATDDFGVLFAMNEVIQILGALSASNDVDPPAQTSLEYVAGLAERSGIAFKVPKSKFPVPFPYGTTLERLAAIYLGDADRWLEIAELNGLRNPYIDEAGFWLPLLVNGEGNDVLVEDSTNLFLGQTVWISGDTTNRIKRTIASIHEFSPGQNLVTLDGVGDLATYTTTDNAILEAFLPGTVNSRQVIYIPSNNPSDIDPEFINIPGVDALDPIIQIGGMDLQLTSRGDLVMDDDGDCRIATGLTAIVQDVKLALTTPRGSLLQHLEYGLGIQVGSSVADLSPQQLLEAARAYFLQNPTFSGVRRASVLIDGSKVYLSIEVQLAQAGTFLPITVEIQK